MNILLINGIFLPIFFTGAKKESYTKKNAARKLQTLNIFLNSICVRLTSTLLNLLLHNYIMNIWSPGCAMRRFL